ncbi:UxaA family hydrolase [bacterium]|nr:UxaA family hydrolase [bacterium]
MIHFLIHSPQDSVGVAVVDLVAGQQCRGVEMENGREIQLVARTDVPLGHKIALSDLAPDQPVLKYGLPIGKATQKIARGECVHVHNLCSRRWQAK